MFSSQAVVVHIFNANTQGAETGESLSWRPAWFTSQVLEQAPKLQRNPVSDSTLQKHVLK